MEGAIGRAIDFRDFLGEEAPRPRVVPPVRAALGRGQLAFFGYGPKRVAHFLSTTSFTKGEPEVVILTDVVALPHVRPLYEGATGRRIGESEAAYFGPDGPRSWTLAERLAHNLRRQAPDHFPAPADAPVHRRTVLFLGGLSWHYGHMLCDVLSRVWALYRFDGALEILLTPGSPDPFESEPMATLLRLAGIEPSRVVRIDRPTRFAQVICPLPALHWSERVFGAFDRPHRRIGRELAGLAQIDDRPTYLSRRGLGGGASPDRG